MHIANSSIGSPRVFHHLFCQFLPRCNSWNDTEKLEDRGIKRLSERRNKKKVKEQQKVLMKQSVHKYSYQQWLEYKKKGDN